MTEASHMSFELEDVLLNNINNNIDAIFYVYDLNSGKELWTNNKAEKLLGYEADTVSIHTIEFTASLLHPNDKSVPSDKLSFFNSGKGKTWSGIYRIKHKQGHWLWVYTTITRSKILPSKNSHILFGIIFDITRNLNTTNQIEAFLLDTKRFQNRLSISRLTRREIQVLKLIATGKSYTQIGKLLNIQPDTVNQHRKNIKKKLNLSNIALLSCFAKETGLV